jgi:hypothetical protein
MAVAPRKKKLLFNSDLTSTVLIVEIKGEATYGLTS